MMRRILLFLLLCFPLTSYAAAVTCYLPNYILKTSGQVIVTVGAYVVTTDDGRNLYVPVNNCIVEW